MNLKRIALLGVFAAFVAVVGAGAFSSKPASALTPSTKICTPVSAGTPAGQFPFTPSTATVTLNCTLALNAGPAVFIAPGTSIQVTLFGAGATFSNVSFQSNCGGNVSLSAAAPASFAGPGGTPLPAAAQLQSLAAPGGFTLAGQSYFVNVFNPLGCFDGTIIISELITLPAAAVAAGTIAQQLNPVAAFNPGALPGATVIATGPGGVGLQLLVATPAFGGVTPGGPFPVTISLVGCSVVATSTSPFIPGALVTTINPGQTAVCRFDLDDNEPGFLATSVAGVTTGTTACVAATGTFPTQASITASGATAIAASECVSSGQVVGTFTSTLAGALFNGLPVASGGTFTLRCPGGVVTAANACDFVDVVITAPAVSAAAALGAVTLTLNYDPDIDAQNTGAQQTFTVVTIIAAIIPINIPVGLQLACVANNAFTGGIPGFGIGQVVGTPGTAVVPGQISNNTLLAVGLLPASVTCTVRPINAAGQPIAIPAGTFEISSLNGALIDASGRLATNLRIGCGEITTNQILTGTGAVVTNAVNSCVGVTFSVAGTGVGLVEVRARYEPRDSLTLAGELLGEFEVAGSVAFVAPQSAITLTLSPNPVAVGATGTATATFQTAATVCGTGTVTIFCVDPTTGLPLLTNAGSILNGFIVFSIDNTAIARFVSGQQAVVTGTGTTTTTGSVFGVTNTTTAVSAEAGSVTLRCGALASGVTTAGGTLGSFFGGCGSASATYRGITSGSATITATFFPDLPGAVSSSSVLAAGLTPVAFTGFSALNFTGFSPVSRSAVLQVLEAAPTGNINLVRGCNNVSPTVTESVSAFIARVMGTTVISVWEYQAATNTFLGAPGPGAPAGAPGDLAGVTRLRPVFVCVTGPGTLNQPAA